MPLKENIANQILTLKAPATIARNTALSSVQPDHDGNIPYIVCSNNPNGTYAIVTAGRTLGRNYFIPKCHIMVEIGDSQIILPGELIREIGTAAQPAGDTSEPGVVLAIF